MPGPELGLAGERLLPGAARPCPRSHSSREIMPSRLVSRSWNDSPPAWVDGELCGVGVGLRRSPGAAPESDPAWLPPAAGGVAGVWARTLSGNARAMAAAINLVRINEAPLISVKLKYWSL